MPNKDNFDVNAIRPDAARSAFKQIRAQHESGYYVEVLDIFHQSLVTPPPNLLPTTK